MSKLKSQTPSVQSEELPVHWVASSRKDLMDFPVKVVRAVGYALYAAQLGGMSGSAKVLKGFSGASVLEICENENTDTYRVVYTVQFKKAVYVLHAFQKKSHSGIKTDKSDIDLIKQRLKAAEAHYKETYPL